MVEFLLWVPTSGTSQFSGKTNPRGGITSNMEVHWRQGATPSPKTTDVLRFEFFESWKNRLRYIIYRFLSSSNIFILLKPWTCMKRCSCSSRSSLDPQKRYPWLFVWPGGGGAARGRSWDSINVSLSGGAVNGKPWA